MKRVALTIFLLLIFTASAMAVMPPGVYRKRSEEAEVKAIAVIKEVAILKSTEAIDHKRVTFETEYALTKETKPIFYGRCQSVRDGALDKIPVGGTIYFGPHEGSRVFVTVTGNNGEITSITPMTPELEKVIRETPERITYGMSQAYIK